MGDPLNFHLFFNREMFATTGCAEAAQGKTNHRQRAGPCDVAPSVSVAVTWGCAGHRLPAIGVTQIKSVVTVTIGTGCANKKVKIP
jgi:hypothetical protein